MKTDLKHVNKQRNDCTTIKLYCKSFDTEAFILQNVHIKLLHIKFRLTKSSTSIFHTKIQKLRCKNAVRSIKLLFDGRTSTELSWFDASHGVLVFPTVLERASDRKLVFILRDDGLSLL